MGGDGPRSDVVSATPVAPPLAPANLAAVAGDKVVTLSWSPSEGATSYSVYRGTFSNKQASVPIAQGLADPAFVDNTVVNGPTYYYKVTATNAGGKSPRSAEASASPRRPRPRLTRTRCARSGSCARPRGGRGPVRSMRSWRAATTSTRFSISSSPRRRRSIPNTLYSLPTEMTQEHFMHLALTGPDQLRQRVAWALHKIWVVSAVEVPAPTRSSTTSAC